MLIFALNSIIMDLATEKLGVLQTIMNTNDEGLIMDVKAFLTNREND
jgi:hypothetical protein